MKCIRKLITKFCRNSAASDSLTKLTEDECEIYARFLEKRFVSFDCPLCGGDFSFSSYIPASHQFSTKRVLIQHRYFPLLTLICCECFYVQQHALAPLEETELFKEIKACKVANGYT